MLRVPKTVLVPLLAIAGVAAGGVVVVGAPWHTGRSVNEGRGSSSPGPPPSGAAGPVSSLPALEAGWVKAENSLPGTTGWHLTQPSRHGEIEGYANAVSVERGSSVDLYVSTTRRDYTVELYRMGYYGGAGGRLVWTSPVQPGHLQPAPSVAPHTYMVATSWTPSLHVVLDPSWPPGDYLFKLVAASLGRGSSTTETSPPATPATEAPAEGPGSPGTQPTEAPPTDSQATDTVPVPTTAATETTAGGPTDTGRAVGGQPEEGPQSYVPLTVRDDESHAAILIQNSVTTWQAYNLWGGYDLYEGTSGNGASFDRRSRVVSFDRPYRIGDGSGDFLGNEFPFVSLVESLGLDVSYETDIDLHEHPERLLQHRAFISLGHDEYWSTAMRDGAEQARDQGINLAFLGANAVFRRIRLEPSPLGPDRLEVNYKNGHEDPLDGIDDANVTADWPAPPAARPESTLTGETYQCNPVKVDFVVTEPGSWIFAGTGLGAGAHIKDLVGSEYDGFDRHAPGPTDVEIVAHSPLRCRGTPGYSDFTYYSAPSGAGVIDTGTNLWVPKLSDPTTAPLVAQITENILSAFAAGPAGAAHVSVANYATLPKATYFPGGGGTPTTAKRRRSTTTASTVESSPTGRSPFGSGSTTTGPGTTGPTGGGSTTTPATEPTTAPPQRTTGPTTASTAG